MRSSGKAPRTGRTGDDTKCATTPQEEAGFVEDAAKPLLQKDTSFRAALAEGLAQADRGEFIEEEEMDARFEQMLHS